MRTRALAAACVLAVLAPAGAAAQPDPSRPLVGLALGGGGARGLAHVGVLRYLEEHHIPVHVVAGTSIGGLIGAGFASGMSAAELEAFVTAIDWHAVLGGDLPYDARSFRRKQDRRDYPVRLDLGLRGGLRLPPGFDTGMQVELLLTRYLLPYYAITDFDALPTPFRCTAVDLDRAELVVFGEGDLPRALRATMSQPGIFDPVVIDGRRLADGGLLDNLPVDVARTAGADRVIAVMVEGPLLGPGPAVTALGVVAQSVDVMTLARTREQLAHADVRVQPPLEAFGPADWGRARALIEAGYEAARQAPGLLDLRVDAGSWRRYTEARAARRRVSVPAPAFVAVRGTTLDEQQRIVRLLRPHLGRPIDTRQLERDLTRIIGDRRYALATYRIVEEGGRPGLLVRVETPAHGPPFLHSAVGIRNRGSRRLDLNLGARLSAFDVAGNGSEARVDLAAGSRLAAAGELYLPLGHPRLFLATGGAAWRETGPFAAGVGTVDAREARLEGTVDLGVTSGRRHEARAGLRLSRVSLRDLSPLGAFDVEGVERAARARWAYDGQDSPTIPSRGLHVTTELRYVFTHAGGDGRFGQAETELSWFVPARRHRLFARFAGGTSFGDPVPPVHRFPFGGLFQVSALERRAGAGSHVASASIGYLHRLGDLPPFLGGSLHLGAWLDAGSAFERRRDADLLLAASLGVLVDTPVGPVVLAGSLGEGGRTRVHILVGRLFR